MSGFSRWYSTVLFWFKTYNYVCYCSAGVFNMVTSFIAASGRRFGSALRCTISPPEAYQISTRETPPQQTHLHETGEVRRLNTGGANRTLETAHRGLGSGKRIL